MAVENIRFVIDDGVDAVTAVRGVLEALSAAYAQAAASHAHAGNQAQGRDRDRLYAAAGLLARVSDDLKGAEVITVEGVDMERPN